MAQPDPDPRRGRSASGMVAGRLAHRLVQRRRGRVRPGRRGAGRVEPAPHRHPRPVVLLPARVVAGRHEARVHGHALPRARPGRRVRRRRACRHRPLRPPVTLDEPRLVSRLAVDCLRPPARQPVAGHLHPRHRVAGDAPDHGWHGGRHHPRVGRVGKVPLLSRVGRLRPQHRLARHDVLRPSGHPHPVPGAAASRGTLAVSAPERRGGGRSARRVGRKPSRTRTRRSASPCRTWRSSSRGSIGASSVLRVFRRKTIQGSCPARAARSS